MANATITIYKTKIAPEKNALIEDIEEYLSECFQESYEIQYQKIASSIEVKLDMHQSIQSDMNLGDYASIRQDGRLWYFFLTGGSWASERCYKIELALDVVNTFANDVKFTDKTKVIRKHKDRFATILPFQLGERMRLQKVVDEADEGITAPKVKTNDATIRMTAPFANQRWYLIYRTPEAPSSTSPIECILAPNGEVPYSLGGGTEPKTVYPSDLDSGVYYFWMLEDNEGGTVWLPGGHSGFTRVLGNSYEDGKLVGLRLHKEKYPGTDDDRIVVTGYFQESGTVKMANLMNVGTMFEYLRFNVSRAIRFSTNSMNSDLLGIDELPSMSWAAADSPAVLKKHSQFDLTDSKIVKVIECPYCPVELSVRHLSDGDAISVPNGWRVNAKNELELEDKTQEFLCKIYESEISDLIVEVPAMGYWEDYEQMLRNDIYEPKTLHSSFSTLKILYDSYSSEIQLETLRGSTSSPRLSVSYKQSNAISSNLGFKWDTLGVYGPTKEDYSHYLISSRNNESVIYTNEYLNYQRVGANWDRKNAAASTAFSWLSTGVAAIGAVVGAISSAGTGGLSAIAVASLGIKAGAGMISSVQNTVQSEMAMKQKADELRAQASSVSGADDLNLMNWYGGNKAHLVKYEPTELSKSALNDLFYYCGYAHNEQEKPDLHTRYWFDYVQCEPDFEECDVLKSYLDELRARWSLGVTVFHHVSRYGWDLEQKYENWEKGFFD